MKKKTKNVVNVIIKPKSQLFLRNTFRRNMKIPGILVISVINKLHVSIVFRHIFSQNMKVSCILVRNRHLHWLIVDSWQGKRSAV